jgi:hypothetical protein
VPAVDQALACVALEAQLSLAHESTRKLQNHRKVLRERIAAVEARLSSDAATLADQQAQLADQNAQLVLGGFLRGRSPCSRGATPRSTQSSRPSAPRSPDSIRRDCRRPRRGARPRRRQAVRRQGRLLAPDARRRGSSLPDLPRHRDPGVALRRCLLPLRGLHRREDASCRISAASCAAAAS